MNEQEILDRAERAAMSVDGPDQPYDALLRRRDRKRRNQRLSAGVLGMAVFVATIGIVTTGLPFDRTRTDVVPGEAGAGTTGTGPTEAIGPVPETDYFLDLDTGETTPLPESIVGGRQNQNKASSGGAQYAASPNGSTLAYTGKGDNGNRQIFVANLDGTGIVLVTHDLEAASSPAWSPDGSKIAYIGDHDHRLRDLFVLDLASGESTQLTFATREPDPAAPDLTPWDASSPSFTQDGSSIVYGADRADSSWDSVEFEIRMVPVARGRECAGDGRARPSAIAGRLEIDVLADTDQQLCLRVQRRRNRRAGAGPGRAGRD